MSSSTTTTMTFPVSMNENIASPQSPIAPERPKKTVPHVSYRSVDSEIDLEMSSMPPSGTQTPYEGDTISRRVSGEHIRDADGVQQTIWNPYRNRFRVMASCLTCFGNGLNDSAPGALLADIQKHYGIAYGTVSILFLCNALGFIVAAFFISTLAEKIGRARTLMLSSTSLAIANIALVVTPPFPVLCVAFFFLGIGMAMNLAICQVFIANLANNTALIGIYQGSYGIGGTIGPLIATSLVSKGYLWSRFYAMMLGLAVLNFCLSGWTFWSYEKDNGSAMPSLLHRPADSSKQPVSLKEKINKQWTSLKTLLSNKPTVLGALFFFSYVGAEVTISGWVISFLVQFRNGDPSKVGYVTSGFWGGITFGRFTLSFLAHRMGERRFVFIVTVGALILELLIWFVPSIPGDSVAVALSGVLLGPVAPCSVHIIQRLVPVKMQVAALGAVQCVGSSGGAIAPFMTGMIAQHVGTFVLHPICIGLFVAMFISWWLMPNPDKHTHEE